MSKKDLAWLLSALLAALIALAALLWLPLRALIEQQIGAWFPGIANPVHVTIPAISVDPTVLVLSILGFLLAIVVGELLGTLLLFAAQRAGWRKHETPPTPVDIEEVRKKLAAATREVGPGKLSYLRWLASEQEHEPRRAA